MTFAYRWQRCDATGTTCDEIAGATGASYVLTHAEVGFRVRAAVIATNGDGSATAFSAPATRQRSAPPDIFKEPTIDGLATTGSTLLAHHGHWAGGQPMTYAYQWQRCNRSGQACEGNSRHPGRDR
jgi:hypothetical protein